MVGDSKYRAVLQWGGCRWELVVEAVVVLEQVSLEL